MSTHDGTPGSYWSISMAVLLSRRTYRGLPRRYPPPYPRQCVPRCCATSPPTTSSASGRSPTRSRPPPASSRSVTTRGPACTRPRVAIRGLIDGPGDAYAHLARHHEDEWSLELAVRAGAAADLATAPRPCPRRRRGGGRRSRHLLGTARMPTTSTHARPRAGFVPERGLLQIRVPLPLADTARWPDGVTVRTFVAGRRRGGVGRGEQPRVRRPPGAGRVDRRHAPRPGAGGLVRPRGLPPGVRRRRPRRLLLDQGPPGATAARAGTPSARST